MVRKKRRPKEPFWKKLNPELQHIGEHLGKIVDNSSIKDVTDLAILIACAYGGWASWSKLSPELGVGGAITGAVGYRLATTEGGTPPISQIAGLGILASTVLVGANVPKWWNELPQQEKEKVMDAVAKGTSDLPYGVAGFLTIPTRPEDLVWSVFGVAGTGLRMALQQIGALP